MTVQIPAEIREAARTALRCYPMSRDELRNRLCIASNARWTRTINSLIRTGFVSITRTGLVQLSPASRIAK